MDEMIKELAAFDRDHGWDTYLKTKNREEKIEELYRQVVHLTGELGEFANELKKCRRDNTWNEENLKEEVVDMQIFLMKIAGTLDMDVPREFSKKIARNRERFVRFRKTE